MENNEYEVTEYLLKQRWPDFELYSDIHLDCIFSMCFSGRHVVYPFFGHMDGGLRIKITSTNFAFYAQVTVSDFVIWPQL